MSNLQPIKIEVISDVVCPWCYIGKSRLDKALVLTEDAPAYVLWRPFFLDPAIPRGGMNREEYLSAKASMGESVQDLRNDVVAAAAEEGLTYRPGQIHIKRQPNTIDCHRLIYWAGLRRSSAMVQRLMEAYFRDGADLNDINVLTQVAADCGLRAGAVRDALGTDEDVELILAQVKKVTDKHIKGSPTFVFENTYAVSGAQPPEQLARIIREVSAEVNTQAAG
jgi:predicted DsbA family dithiol-disulfide isomerase